MNISLAKEINLPHYKYLFSDDFKSPASHSSLHQAYKCSLIRNILHSKLVKISRIKYISPVKDVKPPHHKNRLAMAIKSPTSQAYLQRRNLNLPHHIHLFHYDNYIFHIRNISPAKEIKSLTSWPSLQRRILNLTHHEHISLEGNWISPLQTSLLRW